MKIKMKQQITGTRNAERWPAPGDTIVVGDDEGAELCAQGYAEPVAEKPQPDKRATSRKTSTKKD